MGKEWDGPASRLGSPTDKSRGNEYCFHAGILSPAAAILSIGPVPALSQFQRQRCVPELVVPPLVRPLCPAGPAPHQQQHVPCASTMSGVSKWANVNLQLDYYPCAQFAGLHLANALGLYAKRGIEVTLLPPPGAGGDEPEQVTLLPPPGAGGDEPEQIIKQQRALDLAGRGIPSFMPTIAPEQIMKQQRALDLAGRGIPSLVPTIAVGSVEQNVLIPAMARGVGVKAFGTIFQRSPLALGALPGTALSSLKDLAGKKVGMQMVGLELMTSLIASTAFESRADAPTIVAVTRQNKIEALLSGEVAAIQIFDCMESIELQERLGREVSVLSLDSLAQTAGGGGPLPLGYSQVLFATRAALQASIARKALGAFMEASQEGWLACAKDKAAATDAILADREAMGFGKASGGFPYQQQTEKETRLTLDGCLPYVISGEGPVGSIDAGVWQAASMAMASYGYASRPVALSSSLDSTIWPAAGSVNKALASHVTAGKEGWLAVVGEMRAEASRRAKALECRTGRLPTLAVVCVGNPDAARDTLQACAACGIKSETAALPETASFAQVHAAISALNRRSDVDAILLQRPFPSGIDAAALGGFIAPGKDVDGEAPRNPATAALAAEAQMVLDADASLPPPPPWLISRAAPLPVAVEGVMQLLHRTGLVNKVVGGHVAIVGLAERGSVPLAAQLISCGATVSICSQQTLSSTLKALCLSADVIFSAGDSPVLLSPAMVKLGATVVSLSSSVSVTLFPDVTFDVIDASTVAALLLNIVKCAEGAARAAAAEARHKSHESGAGNYPGYVAASGEAIAAALPLWALSNGGVSRTFKCASFSSAVDFVAAIRILAERANHHPTIAINQARVCEQVAGGCDVTVDLVTFAKKGVTEVDVVFAQRVDALVLSAPF
ncbi:tetrahydrofolate dehydrogenase/cyclohydrolase [Baffinella frigidus]|nr:tetrahydrofolate dehydrogenase/cyclohydrolase [Cryptophyta sp. CCMP2293]